MAKYTNIYEIEGFICKNFTSFADGRVSPLRVYRILNSLSYSISREPAMLGAGYNADSFIEETGEVIKTTVMINRYSGNACEGDWEVRVIPNR